MKVGPSIVGFITELFASNAIHAALYARDGHGGGRQYIDLALLDCKIAAMLHHTMQYLISGIPTNAAQHGGEWRRAERTLSLPGW